MDLDTGSFLPTHDGHGPGFPRACRAGFAPILAILLCLGSSQLRAEDDARAKLAASVAQGEDLYKRAALIVAEMPTTETEAHRIVVTMGEQWHEAEHAFQESFWPMNENRLDFGDDVQEGMIRIWQFDTFVSNAVGATYACRNVEAQWQLKIARQTLLRAKMATQGHPEPGWNPNLGSMPNDNGRCS
ncbi:MAG: hypothetical protein ACHQAY_20250 [Hyphomicrobiales bacterium]